MQDIADYMFGVMTMTEDITSLASRLSLARDRFEKSYRQIHILDRHIRDMEHRYRRAVCEERNSFRYNLRLKLSIATGIKMMFHHYASIQVEEINSVRRHLGLFTGEDSDEDDMSEDEAASDSPPEDDEVTMDLGNMDDLESLSDDSLSSLVDSEHDDLQDM